MSNSITIHTDLTVEEASKLDGNTYQIHRLPDGKLKLYKVEIYRQSVEIRCPVIIGGEQCGRPYGHLGKHMWNGGD